MINENTDYRTLTTHEERVRFNVGGEGRGFRRMIDFLLSIQNNNGKCQQCGKMIFPKGKRGGKMFTPEFDDAYDNCAGSDGKPCLIRETMDSAGAHKQEGY